MAIAVESPESVGRSASRLRRIDGVTKSMMSFDLPEMQMRALVHQALE